MSSEIDFGGKKEYISLIKEIKDYIETAETRNNTKLNKIEMDIPEKSTMHGTKGEIENLFAVKLKFADGKTGSIPISLKHR